MRVLTVNNEDVGGVDNYVNFPGRLPKLEYYTQS